MLKHLNKKRVKLLSISFLIALVLFVSKIVPRSGEIFYVLFLAILSCVSLVWALELKFNLKLLKSTWLYMFILPVHIAIGAAISFFGFPNLSLIFRLILLLIIFFTYYVTLLVLNVFAVIIDRGKVIPLYRVAITWAQILSIVVSIPLFSGVFKISIHPFVHVSILALSSFSLVTFLLWALNMVGSDRAVKEGHFKLEAFGLAGLCTLWVVILAVAIMFLPFEALFRALFLSSVLLFGLGFAHNYTKHTLSKEIIIEHLTITLVFLILGLVFFVA